MQMNLAYECNGKKRIDTDLSKTVRPDQGPQLVLTALALYLKRNLQNV